MLKSWKTCLGLSLLLTAPAFAQNGNETTIAANPSPATSADQIQITVMGIGSCPVLAPITVDENNVIRAEIRSDCPFIPPSPESFTLQETLDPLEEGMYQLQAVLPDDTLLATNALEVLGEGDCMPSPTVLCLNGNRFQVEVDFETPAGQTGEGLATELTDDSGVFTFFDADNVELIVKALDGCTSSFNSFWIFAAGLTNVRVEMTVTDVVSGMTKTYLNPLSTPFEPILDTRAFETCP
ncbi:MAG: hypothetical protein K0U98_10755 [Deltaproteobacteria bacterium]|nr:hypothetical protein [Deltaproteobacteria bacterium]